MTRETRNAHRAFAHLQADKADLYRAILELFVFEKQHFAIALRPGEVHARLSERVHGLFAAPSLEEIENALRQLADWGNLESSDDQRDVATVEDFYRPRFLYQLSAAGEAAEQALAVFDEQLRKPGELQTTALHDIIELLESLRALGQAGTNDPAKVHHLLRSLSERFTQLTSRAQTFMRGVQRTVDLHEMDLEAFLAYKERLIEYLQRFLGELVTATNRIAALILETEQNGLENRLRAVAEREIADQLDPGPEALASAEHEWRERWQGLRRWFISENNPSQAELLRARARTAIPALLSTVANLNDRRTRRTDRSADCLALARFFARAESEADAHRLWRTAFGLNASRHLRIDTETLDAREQSNETSRTSWLNGIPLQITPRLRKSGRAAARGPARTMVDLSEEREHLERLAAEESRQIEAARERLALGRRMRLGDFETLDDFAFQLLLDLLGDALNRKTNPEAAVEVSSADGSLHIHLAPTQDDMVATIQSEYGDFHGRDHWITIERQ
ncbi:MAG: TIGR02677 family protein [Opitutales bacterium]|nr:TIGR02677 family protein [Opitutales bacterium]MCH8541517.1 TIGR02677 family protein [Opitutales bacterium]